MQKGITTMAGKGNAVSWRKKTGGVLKGAFKSMYGQRRTNRRRRRGSRSRSRRP